MARVLYLSYDGMTDQLGQSQVLPYLKGLSNKGHKITLVSFEKKERLNGFSEISSLCKSFGIEWKPLSYTKKPPVLSTLWDVFKLNKTVAKIVKLHDIEIIHCRGYITALSGLKMKRERGTKFVFDMRGFYADERVDAGLWKLSSPIFKRVYDYFKQKENQFFIEADASVCLTHTGKKIIEGWQTENVKFAPVSVIPCCADLNHFSRDTINLDKVEILKQKFNIAQDELVISYLGSTGTWYLTDEMFMFFKRLLILKNNNTRFLIITHDSKDVLYQYAQKHDVPKDKIIVVPGRREELPNLLSLSQLSLFFIKPAFSKKASSPTKMGEIMGLGIPLICNRGVGDVDMIIEQTNSGVLVDDFTDAEFDRVIATFDSLKALSPEEIRKGAIEYYSLSDGVDKYNAIYESIIKA